MTVGYGFFIILFRKYRFVRFIYMYYLYIQLVAIKGVAHGCLSAGAERPREPTVNQ